MSGSFKPSQGFGCATGAEMTTLVPELATSESPGSLLEIQKSQAPQGPTD